MENYRKHSSPGVYIQEKETFYDIDENIYSGYTEQHRTDRIDIAFGVTVLMNEGGEVLVTEDSEIEDPDTGLKEKILLQ